MPVLSISKHQQLLFELANRHNHLIKIFAKRELNYPTEGAGGKRWSDPTKMCGTAGNSMELSLAIEDFKAILAEIKKLK